jgi:hypothetical protein
MTPESASRALDAVDDLQHLLRMAHSAAHRLEMEVCGPAFERADIVAQDIHRVRRLAEELKSEVERATVSHEPVPVHPPQRTLPVQPRPGSFLGRKTV